MPEKKNPFYGATFAERKAIRDANADTKTVESDEVEDKAVAAKKTSAKRRKAHLYI